MRDGKAVLNPPVRRLRIPTAAVLAMLLGAGACEPRDPELVPDEVLQTELGLTERDRVYTVTVTGGRDGALEPAELQVEPGTYVQFVTDDWLVHEVLFEADSLAPAARRFMGDLGQMASPPMVDRGSRFVLSFVDAPLGRYPFRVEGNGAPVRGAVVVADPDG